MHLNPLTLVIAPIFLRFLHYGYRVRKIIKFSGQGWPIITTWGICYFSSAGLLIYSFATLPELRNTEAVITNPAYYLLWAASTLRVLGLEELGSSFHEDIVVEKDQKLIQSGFYSIFRHPLHFFLQLEIASMVWFITLVREQAVFSWCWGLVAIGVITTIIHEVAEETELIKAFGQEYVNYMKKSWGFTDFLPFYKVKVE